MFKRFFVLISIGFIFLYGCTKNDTGSVRPASFSIGSSASYRGYAMRSADDEFSVSIPIDSANRMIQSYLYSINYPANDSGLRSLSFNADTLRAYLSDNSIKQVKFMLAHQAGYMNSGNFGQFAGMNPSALTFVIVGVSGEGTHVHNTRNQVYEHLMACPFMCDGVYSDDYIH